METKEWKVMSNDSCKNIDNNEINDAFNFNIDLDNYESISLVTGLTEYIRNEIRSELLQKKLNINSLKLSFKKWKN